MWILQTFGKTFYLTTKQKDNYLEAIGNGAKYVKCGNLILSDQFNFIVSEEEMEKHRLLGNPILRDEDFIKWKQGKLKNPQIQMLDTRYPLSKFAKEWKEANNNWDKIIKI